MKKLLTFLTVLFSFAAISQTTIMYQPSTAIFSNPERGFWKFSDTYAASYTPLNQTTLSNYRLNDNITLVYRGFYLETFFNSNISAAYLANMQTDFNRARNAGVKLIVRFAYSDDTGAANQQPNKARI